MAQTQAFVSFASTTRVPRGAGADTVELQYGSSICKHPRNRDSNVP
jgi:hypothetical protein